MKDMEMKHWLDDDDDDRDFSIDRGIIVVVEGMAWGPFELPEQALGWALKHKPDNLFKLMPLLNPAIV
jgi:hypothetical protein